MVDQEATMMKNADDQFVATERIEKNVMKSK